RLDVIERRRFRMAFAGMTDIRNNPITPRRNREYHQNAVTMPVCGDFRGREWKCPQMNVGQNPVTWQCIAEKRQAETMSHGAVGTLAADQPLGLERPFAVLGGTQRRRDTFRRWTEGDEFGFTLDTNAEVRQMRFEQPLRFRLRQHQSIRVRAVYPCQADMADK